MNAILVVRLVIIVMLTLFLPLSSFSNVLIVSETPLKGKVALSQEDIDFVNTLVTYSLNDLSDVLPYGYIDITTAQDWYNSVVDIVNATNTNVVMVKGKPSVPKPLPKLKITTLNAQALSTLTKLIPDIKGAVISSYSVAGNVLKVSIQYLDQTGKAVNRKNIDIPLAILKDRDSVLLQVKENIVDLLNAWKFYYYDPKRTATVNISVKPTPKDLSILVKPDNLQLKPGKNTLNEGEYTLLISASGIQPIITNILVPPGGNINLSFNLLPAQRIDSPVPVGIVYIDANVKGVPLIVAEGNVFGTTPLLTNLTEGVKNLIFQQTPTTLLKSAQIEVKPNQLNYYYINLERVGAGVNIIADNNSYVVINRKLEGIVTAGSYSRSLTRGIHTITIFKNGFEAFRTNINITSDEKVTLRVSLSPKKVPVYIVTPQSREAIVSYQGRNVGTTPYSLRVDQGREAKVDIVAQEVGFNNATITLLPSMTKINSVVQNLSPLYGDLLILTDPIDAIVKIDGRIVGKTGLDGLLLRSISSRRSFIFIQKEGYKAVKTNLYILPNVQNSLSYKLKEAPIKLFINTLPVQNVSIYMNEEYYGENDGIVNVELGNFVMKLLKRGFRTVYTNVSFPDKVDSIIPITIQMTPGLSEPEVIEQANSDLITIDTLVSNGNYIDAYDMIRKVKEQIISSGYTNFSKEVLSLYNLVVTKERQIAPEVEFAILSREANDVVTRSEAFSRVGAYEEGIKVIREFFKKVDASSLSQQGKDQVKGIVRDKYKELAFANLNSKVSNSLVQIDRLVARGEKSVASSLYEESIKMVDEYVVEFPEIEADVMKIRNTLISNYIPLGIEVISNKVEVTLVNVDDLDKKKNYTNAVEVLSSAIKEIRLSKLYFLDQVKAFEARLNQKYEEIISKMSEEEQMGEARKAYEEIKPILKEAVRLASIKEYDSAIRKYKEALEYIEISEFKENPFFKRLKDDIISRIVELEQEKKREEEERAKRLKLQEEIEKRKADLPWWTRMQRAWTGVGFEIFGSFLIPSGADFYTTNMNIPIGAKLHISFLPILGLSFGGYYNVNSSQVYQGAAYLGWFGFGQITLRIPIVKQFSLFGSFGTGFSQLINEPLRFRLGNDYLLNSGIDLKFNWFGIRLFYNMAFYDNFNKNQVGGGMGIVFWATED